MSERISPFRRDLPRANCMGSEVSYEQIDQSQGGSKRHGGAGGAKPKGAKGMGRVMGSYTIGLFSRRV